MYCPYESYTYTHHKEERKKKEKSEADLKLLFHLLVVCKT